MASIHPIWQQSSPHLVGYVASSGIESYGTFSYGLPAPLVVFRDAALRLSVCMSGSWCARCWRSESRGKQWVRCKRGRRFCSNIWQRPAAKNFADPGAQRKQTDWQTYASSFETFYSSNTKANQSYVVWDFDPLVPTGQQRNRAHVDSCRSQSTLTREPK
jgi:hypothetical protein